MDFPLPQKPLKSGLVNFPGTTPASAALVAELLHKDLVEHHCFWNDINFTNHLSHHILTLYDLGAQPACIQQMFDKEAKIQRPLDYHEKMKPANGGQIIISEDNWTEYLGKENVHAYPYYLQFFSSQILKHGVSRTLERYVFSPEANANDALMLGQFVSSLLHPLIQAGFGLEFGQDFMIAQGLAQAAVVFTDAASVLDAPSGLPEIKSGPPTSLLELLREVLASPQLKPPAYEPTTFESTLRWMREDPERGPAIRDIFQKWTFNLDGGAASDADIESKIDECLWQAGLLLGGCGLRGSSRPRVDFFLMHLLTGALFLRPVVRALEKPLHKAQLLQAYVRSAALLLVLRGRPRINCVRLMQMSTEPAPSKGLPLGGSAWLPILNNACAHPEAHVSKAIRMLYYCAQRFGGVRAGAVPGALDAEGKETHQGIAKVDGTLFIRVAGVATQAVGWVTHGEKEQFWDVSGMGWDEAWEEEEKHELELK